MVGEMVEKGPNPGCGSWLDSKLRLLLAVALQPVISLHLSLSCFLCKMGLLAIAVLICRQEPR